MVRWNGLDEIEDEIKEKKTTKFVEFVFQIITLLNDVYSRFDKLVDKHQCYKVPHFKFSEIY